MKASFVILVIETSNRLTSTIVLTMSLVKSTSIIGQEMTIIEMMVMAIIKSN